MVSFVGSHRHIREVDDEPLEAAVGGTIYSSLMPLHYVGLTWPFIVLTITSDE
jgi:hypothetical protein